MDSRLVPWLIIETLGVNVLYTGGRSKVFGLWCMRGVCVSGQRKRPGSYAKGGRGYRRWRDYSGMMKEQNGRGEKAVYIEPVEEECGLLIRLIAFQLTGWASLTHALALSELTRRRQYVPLRARPSAVLPLKICAGNGCCFSVHGAPESTVTCRLWGTPNPPRARTVRIYRIAQL